ncbi:MAG: hypothetical protein WA964_14600 [Ilumatobacter sp.]|uniref:hypothetical protein n=1 Tax=Ilumatobacter sp. TaxID=1967498 RepID=UPI003C78A5ED
MSGSAVTPPKGRATRARNDSSGGRSVISPKLQWLLAIVLALGVMGAVFYFGRDVRSDYNGAPAEAPAVVIDTLGI